MSELIYEKDTYEILGSIFRVYEDKGCGFLEAVYQEALTFELQHRIVPHTPQKELRIYYKERLLEKYYVADFLCYDSIIVELKAEKNLTNIDEAQLLNYLKATRLRLGLLINFGSTGKLEWTRWIK